jgi:nucleoside-diphosphate-sugar epimerase
MAVLLVGCTGFLGEALIYKLLNETDKDLVLVIRTKDNKTIQERVLEMFDSIKLSYDEYKNRLKLIQVSYDDRRNIAISAEDDEYIKKNVTILVNALADVHFNRELRKAALNNTVTALQWMRKFQQCEKGETYLYISTAFVNFHRIQSGKIPEKILEKNMSQKTLKNILDNKQSTFGNYENSYVYTKQLAEVLLNEERNNKHLVIIRPSIIIPAMESPFPGWGKIQTMSYFILGVGSGLLSMLQHTGDNYQNTVPVDIVAQDCLITISEKVPISPSPSPSPCVDIRHCCLTGNVKTWLSHNSIETLRDRTYQYFIVNPLILNQKKLFPHKVEFKRNWWHMVVTFIVHLIYMIYHWWKWSDSWEDFFRILYKNLLFTYKFDKNLSKFSQKKIIFQRKKREKDIKYPSIAIEDCYYEFVKNLQNIISSDAQIINLFF